MLLNTDISFALKNTLGEYDIKDISIFELENLNKKFSGFKISLNRNKEVNIRIKCPLCGEEHNYFYSINDILNREMIIGGCEVLGMPLFYMGNKFKVLQRISKFNEINRNRWAMI